MKNEDDRLPERRDMAIFHVIDSSSRGTFSAQLTRFVTDGRSLKITLFFTRRQVKTHVSKPVRVQDGFAVAVARSTARSTITIGRSENLDLVNPPSATVTGIDIHCLAQCPHSAASWRFPNLERCAPCGSVGISPGSGA
jgi:hypothetical protein